MYIFLQSFVELRADFWTSKSLKVSGKRFYSSTCRQSGNILILPRSVVKSSAGDPAVQGSCYRGPKSLLATGVWGR